jgi:hypothetical protein
LLTSAGKIAMYQANLTMSIWSGPMLLGLRLQLHLLAPLQQAQFLHLRVHHHLLVPKLSASPSPSAKASASPSASAKASVTPTPSPSASPRVTMPDTTDGTPVTGVFEVTVGTISVGLILLLLGVFGLLVL